MVIRVDYLNYGKQEPSSLPRRKPSVLPRETVKLISNYEPFPHLIIEDFYNKNELELIWEELNFYTKPGKLLGADQYGGVKDKTNAKALHLDAIYTDYEYLDGKPNPNYRNISNILTANRKIITSGILDEYAKLHECCDLIYNTNTTKVRYYHDGEYYEPHKDSSFQTLVFSYFYKEPKRFEGGELYFPAHNYNYSCNNNSIIIFPGWVQHAVNKVKIKESDYYAGLGRYAITSFLFTQYDRR